MHTKYILAEALDKADLNEMADKARTGYYHDYLSPLDFPDLQLASDLMEVGTKAALSLCGRHINGEFDASTEESDECANSPDGKATFAKLLNPKQK